MSEALQELRAHMQSHNFAAYYLPHTDNHNVSPTQSEYLSQHDHRVEFISGFKGSNAKVLITQTEALLWTDGRYWIAVPFK